MSFTTAIPNAQQLLALEERVRHRGTGLQASDLYGSWQLDQIWPKGSRRPASFSGWLLRGLAARLEIRAADADSGAGDALVLSNAVNLGPLELRFRGPGRLVGRRPLLQFSFDQLQVSLVGRVLLQRVLPAPEPQRLPFFALIARDSNGWLAARGRGGGLALWRLAELE
jgi:hypothetical protein